MKSDYIQTRRGRFHYLKWGSGKKPLLAFHGFGNQAERFQSLAEMLSSDFTFYAIDLPYHGLTRWSFPEFKPEDLKELIQILQTQEQLSAIWGMGHSLGGRLWLNLLPDIAQNLKGLFLIAPDGLRTRGLGFAMSLPLNIRRSIARSMQQPDAWLQLASWANQARVLRPGKYRFVKTHLEDQHKRERIIRTWLSMKYFEVDEKKIFQTSPYPSPPIHILLGKRDTLISEKHLSRRVKQWPNTEVDYTEEGHMPRAETIAIWVKGKSI